MHTKLTLTVEEKIIDRAKQYAQKTGRSLSDLVESYLDNITSAKSEPVNELPDDIKKLFGSVKIPLELNHKKEIRKILSNSKK